MLAWRALQYGAYRDTLELQEQPDPTAPKGGVVVKISAAGLNFFDILSIAGQYQVKIPPPFTPGTEAAGTVVAVGEGSQLSVGDRVIASSMKGAFAEQMATPDVGCLTIPKGMSDAQAAGFFINYQTSYFALHHRARLQEGETLLVHGGAGGCGLAAIQLGKAIGATVIATAGSPEKLEVCTKAGADHVINYREDDFVPAVKSLTKGRGADVIYDPVGGDVFDRSTKCIAWCGRLIVIGFAGGRIPEIKVNRVLLKNIAIVGLHWGSYRLQAPQEIARVHGVLTELYEAGKISPTPYGDFSLKQLPEALDALANRQSYGKVVLNVGK